MTLVRRVTALLKDAEVGPRLVPIVVEEARTIGMANMFRQVGHLFAARAVVRVEDLGSMLYYREDTKRQILEEGNSEAGNPLRNGGARVYTTFTVT